MSPNPLPKAELHVHLEGSLEPETLLEINRELTPEEIEQQYRYTGFRGFLQSFVWATRQLQEPGHYALAAQHLLDRLAAQGVVYTEITISAGVVLWRGQNLEAVLQAVQQVAARHAVRVRWILDAIRHFGPIAAWPVVEFAASHQHQGVAAFGIGGDEERGPVEWFAELFAYAKRQGLRLCPHAGEVAGAGSVWGAVRLGADRIGHGIRSFEDPALLRHLRDADIPLEVCVSSNVCTEAVASIEDHPIRRLFDAGVPIVLNTDDPALFRTSLSREYELAAEVFGFSDAELEVLRTNGLRYSFAGTNES